MLSRFVRHHPAFSLPEVVPEQELLFHRDQISRYNRWEPEVWSLADLDLLVPKGSEHGAVLVLPASKVPVSGWASIRKAVEEGQDTLKVLVGDKLNLRWYPFSRQERLNKELFDFVKSRRAGSMGMDDPRFMEKLREWMGNPKADFNAIDAAGKSVLDFVAGLYPSTGGRDAARAIAWTIEAGALPNRLTRMPGDDERAGHTIAQQLLARFHVSAVLNDKAFALPDSLLQSLLMPQFDWLTPHNRAALDEFFSKLRPEVGFLEGAEGLKQVWRQAHLDVSLPITQATARPKPRF